VAHDWASRRHARVRLQGLLRPGRAGVRRATVHWHDTSGGWRQPTDAVGQVEDQLSARGSAMLQALMDVGVPGRDRLDFLG
jgi:hypothetical protein